MSANSAVHISEKRYTDGDIAILFVHGIQGSPNQFRFLLERLENNVSYYNLLLPGHGANYLEFRASGVAQWLDSVCAAAKELRLKYKKVYYVGHSMGCLLGMMAHYRENICFDGMLLLACPLKLRITYRYIQHNFLGVTMKNCRKPEVQASQKANSVHVKRPWNYLGNVHPYAELLRLIRQTKRELRAINCPISAVHMGNDEIVSARSLELLSDVCHAKSLICEGCSHNYFTPEAKDVMNRLLCDMISGQ